MTLAGVAAPPSRHGAAAPTVARGVAAEAVASAASAWRRVGVVADAGLVAAGHVAPIVAALRARAQVVVVDRVGPEPTDASVASVAAALGEALGDVDGVVAVGGGSVLDSAKGALLTLAWGSTAGRGPGPADPEGAAAPLRPWIAVPTTAGTGSDAQSFAILGGPGGKRAVGHPGLTPVVAVLDPTLAATAPRQVAVRAGLDATVHAVEAAVTSAATPASAAAAVAAFGALWRALPAALAGDLAAWAAMLDAAHLAGAAIEASMLGAAHACANPLSDLLGWAHGDAVARTVGPVVRQLAAQGVAYGPLEAAAGIAPGGLAAALEARADALGVPPLALGAEVLPQLVARAGTQWTLRFSPRPVDLARVYGAA